MKLCGLDIYFFSVSDIYINALHYKLIDYIQVFKQSYTKYLHSQYYELHFKC